MSVSAPIPELRTAESPPWYRDVRVVRWVGQIAVVVVVFGFLYWLYNNFQTNIEARNLPTGWDWLYGKFGSAIQGVDDAADLPNWRAYFVGYTNTLRVILLGIPGCTIIGILIGVARLSDNLAVRAFGTAYVEMFRNIPALVWIFLAHLAIAIPLLPAITETTPFAGIVVSNRGIGIPWFNPDANLLILAASVLVGGIVTAIVVHWRGRVNAETGEPARGGLYGTIAFIITVIIGSFAAGNAFALDPSGLDDAGRNVIGGMTIQVPYFSVTVALTLYTASHVAEVVRGAILAIHKGQTEAANAIALSTFQRYRYIILPQAFRIMIPPLANQYLNITKNSSLALAFSYVEIAAIFNRLANNAAPATSVIVILMLMYLSFSLTISMIANYFNRRLSLETR